MAKRSYEGKMRLEMPFGEALERFAGTSSRETHANIKRSKKKKPLGGKKQPPSGSPDDPQNVVRLRHRRKPHNV